MLPFVYKIQIALLGQPKLSWLKGCVQLSRAKRENPEGEPYRDKKRLKAEESSSAVVIVTRVVVIRDGSSEEFLGGYAVRGQNFGAAARHHNFSK